jgi:hypothetical protein
LHLPLTPLVSTIACFILTITGITAVVAITIAFTITIAVIIVVILIPFVIIGSFITGVFVIGTSFIAVSLLIWSSMPACTCFLTTAMALFWWRIRCCNTSQLVGGKYLHCIEYFTRN